MKFFTSTQLFSNYKCTQQNTHCTVEAKLDCVAISEMSQLEAEADASNTSHTLRKVNSKTTIAEIANVLVRETDTYTAAANRQIAFHSADSKQPHVFTKISLDANEHPYFRRVWFGRHRLDENSPLLTPAARERVKAAGGHWPADMNNYVSIKRSLHFRHILVAFSGTANANAADVFAQKVYDLVDVNVGYRFVPMNFRDAGERLKTDPYLLNCVVQQRGLPAEPIH